MIRTWFPFLSYFFYFYDFIPSRFSFSSTPGALSPLVLFTLHHHHRSLHPSAVPHPQLVLTTTNRKEQFDSYIELKHKVSGEFTVPLSSEVYISVSIDHALISLDQRTEVPVVEF